MQLDSPSKLRSSARRPDDASKVASGNVQATADDDIEVVPDSEEERYAKAHCPYNLIVIVNAFDRTAARRVLSTKYKRTASPEIIEISSDDETPTMYAYSPPSAVCI